MNKKVKRKWLITASILVLLILAVLFISLNTGSLAMTPSKVIQTLLGQGSRSQQLALFELRMPRIIMAILVGGALALSGSVLQGVTKNDLADAGILGINSGAALFVVMYIYFMNGNVYSGISNLTIFTMPIVALVGAIIGAMLIYILAWNRGIKASRLLLIGIGINIAFTSLLTIFQLRFTTTEYNRIMAWTSGSIWGTSWKYVYAVIPFILIVMGLIYYKARYLDVMHLGDELATGLGVKVERTRLLLLFLAVILAGVATSVAGNIAFLGLIAPHMARRLVGPKHKRQLPIAALIGILILLGADTLARSLFAPIEIPVGIVVAVIGVPYFIYLMLID